MKIVADANIPFVKDYFGIYGDLILKSGRSIVPADVKDADMLLVRSITPVNQHLLEDSAVKFVGSVTAGADHLETQWLDQAGITWCIAEGFNAPPVADYVVACLAALRKKGLFPKKKVRAAVIGVGNVGKLVAERLKRLDIEVVLCDPLRAAKEANFASTPLEQLSHLDLISLHVPLTHRGQFPTYHFIDEDFLQRQNKACVLLNASRGAVINSEDLLKAGNHLYWCLDVWEHEPLIQKEILQQAIIATPHIAGYSVQSKIRGIDTIYKLACQKNIIPQQAMSPIKMPTQELSFAGANRTFEEIVLGVFNPFLLTAMMRSVLMPEKDYGPLFDEIRNQFNYRYEFAYTQIDCLSISPQDKQLLQSLQFKFRTQSA